jgi:Zn-dependent protease/CBS domain-containing protein
VRPSLRLGRIAGIEIGVHYTWLFAFALIAWSLAEGFFPSAFRGSRATYWATGVLAALLLFVSVIVHELAHSVVARARGMTVNGITLFIFGGVSNLGDEAKRPQDEFAVAVVGPLISLALAGVAWGLLQLLGGGRGPVTATLEYLALINALLAAFNMLPGFPLDGGRVLRSILWATMRSLVRATNIAAGVGQVCAWLLIAWGFFQVVVQGDLFGGLWIALIGWFLNSAADASRREVRVRGQFQGVRVQQVMEPSPDTVSPETSVAVLVEEWFLQRGRRAMPVRQGDRLVGIVTLTDVKGVPQQRWAQAQVAEIMTRSPLYSVRPEDDVALALQLLAEHDIHQVVVLQGERLVGLLTRAHLIRYMQFAQELGVKPGAGPSR